MSLLLHGCIESFSPPEITSASSYLVVDGFLNTSSSGSSQIKLSRTQNVTDLTAPQVEPRAQIRVEGDKGSQLAFTEAQPGTYKLEPIAYREGEKYRLHIRTSDGKEYLSDYVPAIQTPPIDSVTYRVQPDQSGVQIYVSTHDPLNTTRFYRWSFDETWMYQMPLYSAFEVVNNEMKLRTEDISTCWSHRSASRILVGSSIKLSEDIIQDASVTYVPASSGKLRVKYSILVKQYGLSQEEYEYWTALAKTTESTGSLFDPQPAQVTGNIRCVSDPKELVFGFFSASKQQEQRLFITEYLGRYVSACEPTDTLALAQALQTLDLILVEFPVPGSSQPLYITGTASCADCRLEGGTTTKPEYWR
ncbi:hypothetical protein GCM10027291_14200 [Telluribacter humicola]